MYGKRFHRPVFLRIAVELFLADHEAEKEIGAFGMLSGTITFQVHLYIELGLVGKLVEGAFYPIPHAARESGTTWTNAKFL